MSESAWREETKRKKLKVEVLEKEKEKEKEKENGLKVIKKRRTKQTLTQIINR